jgi:hypothetical protein
MNYYKISKDLWSTIQKFESLDAAQAFADSLGEGYTAEYYAPYTPPTLQERLTMDLQFGQDLVYVFVEDNRIMNITPAQSEAVLVKFRDILAFAQTGAITSINTYLPAIPVDEVFTQERKDKYMQMITDYLAQFA